MLVLQSCRKRKLKRAVASVGSNNCRSAMVRAVTSPVKLARTRRRRFSDGEEVLCEYANRNSTLGGAASRRGHLNTFLLHCSTISGLAEILRDAHVRAPLLRTTGAAHRPCRCRPSLSPNGCCASGAAQASGPAQAQRRGSSGRTRVGRSAIREGNSSPPCAPLRRAAEAGA